MKTSPLEQEINAKASNSATKRHLEYQMKSVPRSHAFSAVFKMAAGLLPV